MGGFTKLDSGIIDSSIWNEDSDTRCVWITLLAKADENGTVFCVPTALARQANVPLERCLAALDKFQLADSESRSSVHEGRRIKRIEGGWILLNYRAYREKDYTAKRREQSRKLMERLRIERAAANKLLTSDNSYASASASVPEGVVRGNANVLALKAHAAFCNPPSVPQPAVVSQIAELLAHGRTEADLLALFAWRKTTKNEFRPQSVVSLTDPKKWETWQGQMQSDNRKANSGVCR